TLASGFARMLPVGVAFAVSVVIASPAIAAGIKKAFLMVLHTLKQPAHRRLNENARPPGNPSIKARCHQIDRGIAATLSSTPRPPVGRAADLWMNWGWVEKKMLQSSNASTCRAMRAQNGD